MSSKKKYYTRKYFLDTASTRHLNKLNNTHHPSTSYPTLFPFNLFTLTSSSDNHLSNLSSGELLPLFNHVPRVFTRLDLEDPSLGLTKRFTTVFCFCFGLFYVNDVQIGVAQCWHEIFGYKRKNQKNKMKSRVEWN